MKRRVVKAAFLVAAFSLAALFLPGCVAYAPVLNPAVTLAPSAALTPMPSPTLTPVPTLAPLPTVALAPAATPSIGVYDALGAFVSTPEHYKQYIALKNIQVYEQFGDTFVDAVATNTYPEPIVCAVDILFADGEELVAQGKLQTQDGQYVLILQPGDTTVYAQVNTDMTLTLADFTLQYDSGLGVWPK